METNRPSRKRQERLDSLATAPFPVCRHTHCGTFRPVSKRFLPLLLLSLGLLFAAGCPSEDNKPLDAGPFDSGHDTGNLDAGVDTGVDSGADTGPIDAGHDTGPQDAGPPRALFEVAREGVETGFFDMPWPSDVRRTPDGTIDVRDFPNPSRSALLGAYLVAISERLTGFGNNSPAYFRFSHPVDPATLPSTPTATLASDSTAFIVDIDPDSPDLGTRIPAVIHYHEAVTRWWPGNTVAVRPVYGFPLAADRTYATVVTRGVKQVGGADFVVDTDLAAILAEDTSDGALDATRAVYEPALTTLAAHKVPRESILALAVFTTQDPVSELSHIRDWIVESYPSPTATEGDWSWKANDPDFELVNGYYGPHPIFQKGVIPYTSTGGEFEFDEDGNPVVQQEFPNTFLPRGVRFAISIPKTAMPKTGYPIVIYQHGTGGDYESFFDDRTAKSLARAGVAVISTDQIHHGERAPAGTSPELAFFNFSNPEAAFTNNGQSALDVVQLRRLAPSLRVPTSISSRDRQQVFFDTSGMGYFGHSQGSTNGGLFLAIDDAVRGGVLSGSGGVISITLIEKRDPISIVGVLALGLGVPSNPSAIAAEHIVYEHPAIAMVQTYVERSDPVNFAAYYFKHPRPGFAPKSVLITEGLMDFYANPNSAEAFAAAAGVPLLEPVAREVEALTLQGLTTLTPPVSGNLVSGTVTAGLLQFPEEGHGAIFTNDNARAQTREFVLSLMDGTPVIPAAVE